MKRSWIFGAALAVVAPSAVLAHPKLTGATPAANATVAAPAQVVLRFSERLVPKFASASLVMTGMPGTKDHPPTKVAARTAVGADGKTLVVTPARRLAAGIYRLSWTVVAADTHRVQGGHAFRVR